MPQETPLANNSTSGLGSVGRGPVPLEKYELTESHALQSGGQVAHLSDGFVHYRLSGPPGGKVVVLIHGMATPLFIWDGVEPALVRAGFRVLRYDQFGRGLSARPRTDYGQDLYDRQLVELLGDLSLSGRLHLAGLSMGGLIAAEFAGRHPELVDRVVLMAPAGLGVPIPWTIRMVKISGVGEALLQTLGRRLLLGFLDRNFEDPQPLLPAFRAGLEPQLSYRGYRRTLLSTLRHMPLADAPQTYLRLSRAGREVLALWGRGDKITPFQNSHLLSQRVPGVVLRPLDRCGHSIPYEQPEKVASELVGWFSQPCTPRDSPDQS